MTLVLYLFHHTNGANTANNKSGKSSKIKGVLSANDAEVKCIVGYLSLPYWCILDKMGGASTHLGSFVPLAVCGLGR